MENRARQLSVPYTKREALRFRETTPFTTNYSLAARAWFASGFRAWRRSAALPLSYIDVNLLRRRCV